MSMFSQSWYMRGMKLVEEDNFLIFYERPLLSLKRFFLFLANLDLSLKENGFPQKELQGRTS